MQTLIDYAATYPSIFIQYHVSDMALYTDSDAAYLVMHKARSRISGYYHVSNHPKNTNTLTLNGPILIGCKTIRAVVISVAEAEIRGLFHDA